MSVLNRRRLAVAHDDPAHLSRSVLILSEQRLGPVASLDSSDHLRQYLRNHHCPLVVMDLELKDGGLPLISEINAQYPQTEIIVCGESPEVSTVVECLQHGAYDYLVKPVPPERLIEAAKRALGRKRPPVMNRLVTRSTPLTDHELSQYLSPFISVDKTIRQLLTKISAIAITGEPVFITGESGTGKALLAETIHQLSGRKGKCVSLPCAGLEDGDGARMLFGSRKSAHDDEAIPRSGLILHANAGTLIIDDCDALSLPLQVALVRLLHDGRYFHSDGDLPKVSNARLIFTSCGSVAHLERSPGFRRDLLYSLQAHQVHLPALRDRPSDLQPLTHAFAQMASANLGMPLMQLPDELWPLLAGYPFPGNVRELKSLVFDAVSLSRGDTLSLLPFQEALRTYASRTSGVTISYAGRIPTLREARAHLISEALQAAGGNQARAAATLGITRQAMSQLLSKQRIAKAVAELAPTPSDAPTPPV